MTSKLLSVRESNWLARTASLVSQSAMRSLRLALPAAALLAIAYAQEGPPKDAPPPPQGRREMPAPKNLKILEPQQVMPAMRAFTVALGVRCGHCHVEGNFASDENTKKEVARNMLKMTHDINGNFTDGKMHVTCYTCHRGSTEPATAPEKKE